MVMLTWGRNNKDVLVASCKNDLTQKTHFEEIINYVCNLQLKKYCGLLMLGPLD
jgi:hypothetical protein